MNVNKIHDFIPFRHYLRLHVKKKLREELTRALLEATSIDDGSGVGIRRAKPSNSEPESFKDLVKDMTLNRQDIKAFAFKTKTMVSW